LTRKIAFQRELKLRDAEFQKRLEEKDEENRLACEELELRVMALTNTDESKSKLLRDLEVRLQTAVADSSKFGQVAEKLKIKESEILKLEEEKKILEVKISEMNESLENFGKISENLASAQNELTKLAEEKQILERKLLNAEAASSNFGEVSEILKSKESEMENLAREKSILETEKKSLEENLAELTSTVEEMSTQLNDSKVLNDERFSTIETLTLTIEKNQSKQVELKDQLDNLSAELKEKKETIETLKKVHQTDLENLKNDFGQKAAEQQKIFDGQVSML
jgi:chromosome segregation ATPase